MARPLHLAILAMLLSCTFPATGGAMAGAATPTDAQLVDRVVDVLGAEVKSRANNVARLAQVADARTVVVLHYVAVHDGNLHAAQSAVEGLGALAQRKRHEALVALGQLGADVRDRVATRALDELGKLAPSGMAWEQLLAVARNEDLPQERRRHVDRRPVGCNRGNSLASPCNCLVRGNTISRRSDL